MDKRGLKVLVLLVALSLALGVGAVLGGGAVYALTRVGDVIPVVNAQAGDPEFGIVIASVVPDGPAAQAGVVRGDILLKIDDQTVDRPLDVVRYLEEVEPGEKVELTVLHGDDVRTPMATLDEQEGRSYLGLAPCGGFPQAMAVHVGTPGAVIVEVTPDSPAEGAGLQEGDAIVAINGLALDGENALADLIAGYAPGDTVTLEIERPGEEPRDVTVELGEHPEDEGVAYLGVRYLPFPRFAALGGEHHLPFGEFEFDGLPFVFPEGEIEQGTIVQRVLEDSPAAAAGLKKGDMITALDGDPVESPQALADALSAHEPGDVITLTLWNPEEDKEREVEVTLGEHPDEAGKAYLGVWPGSFGRMLHRECEEGEPCTGHFEVPLDDFDFDLDIMPHHFEFHWPPEDSCDGLSGCPGDSV